MDTSSLRAIGKVVSAGGDGEMCHRCTAVRTVGMDLTRRCDHHIARTNDDSLFRCLDKTLTGQDKDELSTEVGVGWGDALIAQGHDPNIELRPVGWTLDPVDLESDIPDRTQVGQPRNLVGPNDSHLTRTR